MLITSFNLQCFVADSALQEWLTNWNGVQAVMWRKNDHNSFYLKPGDNHENDA